jgi:small GTP-binding protein
MFAMGALQTFDRGYNRVTVPGRPASGRFGTRSGIDGAAATGVIKATCAGEPHADATIGTVTALDHIRNVSIIAHIDHGKSTLADRLLELTGAVDARDMRAQYLDTMDIERERGITIKAQNVRLEYKGYVIHLIDTPGHVDFGYEVSRSLAACEGVILLVDASQGIEAQTLANAYQAIEHDLAIVSALNKIDLPAAEPARRAQEIEKVLGLPAEDTLLISAKTGQGVAELLDAVIAQVPPPKGDPDAALQALLFDSYYDAYRGVVSAVRVFNGVLRTGARLRYVHAGENYDADEVGVRLPVPTPVAMLGPGEVGYLITGVKDVGQAKVGETVTDATAHLEPTGRVLPQHRDEPVVGVLADAPLRGVGGERRVVEDAEEHDRVGGEVAVEPPFIEIERTRDPREQRVTDIGERFDVTEYRGAQTRGPVGEQVRTVQRRPRGDARVVERELFAEIETFLHVGRSRRQLTADRKPPAPRAAAVHHRDLRLLGLRKGEELTGERVDARLQLGRDAVPDDVEEPRVAARGVDLPGECGRLRRAPVRRDVDDRQALHGRGRATRADPDGRPSCRP